VGSEYYRQYGVALFQKGEYEAARSHFDKAPVAMRMLGEAQNEAHVLMAGTMQTNLLKPFQWDKALEVLEATRHDFGTHTLEFSVSAHWAAACGLATDSSAAQHRARELLEPSSNVAIRFGHQATIRKLLSITPELDLYPALRYAWIRRALYENAFRNQ
jgi:hypothetical protein